MATHEGSLASKLLNIRVGETIAIPDTFDDGRAHWLPCEYGKSIFRTRDDIVKRINGEAE